MSISVLGTPEGTRTPDLLIRSQSLYPAELLAHKRSRKRLYMIAQLPKKCKHFFRIFKLFFPLPQKDHADRQRRHGSRQDPAEDQQLPPLLFLGQPFGL